MISLLPSQIFQVGLDASFFILYEADIFNNTLYSQSGMRYEI